MLAAVSDVVKSKSSVETDTEYFAALVSFNLAKELLVIALQSGGEPTLLI